MSGQRSAIIDDRGGGVVQLPLMATVFVVFASLMVFVGRVNSSSSTAEAAARYAARTISLSRDPAAAVDQAQADAEVTVSVGSASCQSMSFDHLIEADHVEVTVTCEVDLVGLGVPGSFTVIGRAEEPLDQWRETTS